MQTSLTERYWIKIAIREGQSAYENGEIPAGAVITLNNKIIGKGQNYVKRLCDPTAHAEIIAISAASQFVSSSHLTHATIYTTIEPCLMCFGAITNAKIERIVYLVNQPKFGFTNFINPKLIKVKITKIDMPEEEKLILSFYREIFGRNAFNL